AARVEHLHGREPASFPRGGGRRRRLLASRPRHRAVPDGHGTRLLLGHQSRNGQAGIARPCAGASRPIRLVRGRIVRILVLGGTSFVGRAIVDDALRHGAAVTLFSRGKTGADLFPDVPRLIGDRETGDYHALRSGSWDAVVDVSGYVPRHVNDAMNALGDRVGRYLFISSHAVYDDAALGPGSAEDGPRRPAVRDTEELLQETYGPLKVACEDDVTARYARRATIVRPGKVAGPHDPQDGLTYWVRRGARRGRGAPPGRPPPPGAGGHAPRPGPPLGGRRGRVKRGAVQPGWA